MWGPVRLLWNYLFLGSDKLGCEYGPHKELRLVLGVETEEMAILWIVGAWIELLKILALE